LYFRSDSPVDRGRDFLLAAPEPGRRLLAHAVDRVGAGQAGALAGIRRRDLTRGQQVLPVVADRRVPVELERCGLMALRHLDPHAELEVRDPGVGAVHLAAGAPPRHALDGDPEDEARALLHELVQFTSERPLDPAERERRAAAVPALSAVEKSPPGIRW
jgi:hypothetical protein